MPASPFGRASPVLYRIDVAPSTGVSKTAHVGRMTGTLRELDPPQRHTPIFGECGLRPADRIHRTAEAETAKAPPARAGIRERAIHRPRGSLKRFENTFTLNSGPSSSSPLRSQTSRLLTSDGEIE